VKLAYSSIIFLFFSVMAMADDGLEDLLVFVGEQVSVTELPENICESDDISDCGFINFDSGYVAKYIVLDLVHGEYEKSNIEFEVYSHRGFPAFAAYKYALLFVSDHDGRLVHQKYQFFDVYRTSDDRWATCGDPNEHDRENVKPAKLQNIVFTPEVYFDVTHYTDRLIKDEFPEPGWKREENRALCRQGVYTDELFRIKNEGVLRARRESEY
jgi:hypothetical protein